MPTSIEGSWIARFVGAVADPGSADATTGRRTQGSKGVSALSPAPRSAPGRESAIAVFTSRDLHLGARGSLLLEAPPRTPGGAEARLATFLERSARAERVGAPSDEPAQKLAVLIERHLHRHREIRALRTRARDALERGGR